MKRPFVALMTLCMLISCREKQVKAVNKPNWVIEEKKMVDIITDLRIADAATYYNTSAPPRDKVKDWNFIMQKHGVQDSIFRKSHDFYAGQPEVAVKIYEEVIDRISEMQADNTDGQ